MSTSPQGMSARQVRTSVDVGIRWLGMAVALLALYLTAPNRFDGYTLAMVAVLGLAIDLKSPFCLRNYFLVYTGGLLLLGGLIYPDLPAFPLDATLFMAAFLLGYGTYRWTCRRRDADHSLDQDLTGPIGSSLESLVWLTAGLQAVRLVVLISQYGIAGFYSGQELASRFQSFTESNSTVGVIIHIALTALIAAVSTIYFEHCLQTGSKPNFRLLVLTLIVMPGISLQRFSLILNSLLLVAIYACYKRSSDRPLVARSNMRRYLPVAILLAMSVGLALKIGDIRATSLAGGANTAASQDTMAAVIKSEFTPVLFYANAKENIDVLGYRYGGNIAGALVTRLVPRSIWEDKPITTAEFYARQLEPGALDRGFVLAPSLFGVGFLNFGLAGTAVLLVVFGAAAAYFDRGYVERLYSRMPSFLLVSTWAFSLLRDDLATSLISLLITFGLYKLFRGLFVRLSDRFYSAAGSGLATESPIG